MLDVGDQLREARHAAGLTQEELAFRSRLSRNYISLLELGSKSPTIETLDRICASLGITVSTVIAKAEKRMSRK
jgi:transcriptional regulator with XRE-family HTH domain